jgi:menaquinone C8-methyltransferase
MITLFSKTAAALTRSEGKKFLKLAPAVDEQVFGAASEKLKTRTSLYVHIPFCRSLCPFCCFNRYLFKEDQARQYFVQLKKELSFYIERGFKFSDFYFGGGTPTILMDELIGFLEFARKNLDVKQLSLETTPREITSENIRLLKEAGINRLSIGIQSFDNEIVRAMGRVQSTAEETVDRVMMAQGQFDTVNIDFVFNFPFQSYKQLEDDIRKFKELKIDQATFYPLMASPHKQDAMERKFNKVDTAREKTFYDIILREVYDAGYQASTAWCYSKGNRMIDEYIIDYDDYIGIGSGSVSIFNGNFFVNSFSLERYGRMVNNNQLPIIGWRKLSSRESMYYYLLTRLFGTQFDPAKFKERFNASIDSRLGMELLAMRALGLIEGKNPVKVTRKGMYPVSVMMREFFTSLNTLREDYIEKQL